MFTVLQVLSLTSDFSSNFQSSMKIFHHELMKEKVGVLPTDELIHHP